MATALLCGEVYTDLFLYVTYHTAMQNICVLRTAGYGTQLPDEIVIPLPGSGCSSLSYF